MLMMMMMMMIMMIGKKTLFHELYTVSEEFRYLGTELNLCWGVFRDSVYRYLGSGHCEVAITDPFPDRYIKRRAKELQSEFPSHVAGACYDSDPFDSPLILILWLNHVKSS